MKRLPKISHPENVIIRRGRCQAFNNISRLLISPVTDQKVQFFVHLLHVRLFRALSFCRSLDWPASRATR